MEAFHNTAGGAPDEVYFFNSNDGIAIGDPPNNRFEIWLTHNGGSTWQQADSNNVPEIEPGEAGHGNVYATHGNNIWFVSFASVSGHTFVYHSADKGNSWTKVDDGNDNFDFFINEEIAFTDDLHGLEKSGTVLRSTDDGGNTWSDLSYSGTVFPLVLAAVPYTPGYYVTSGAAFDGMSGTSFSPDYGHTWHLIDTAVDHMAIGFYNSNIGYSGGSSKNGNGGAFILLHGNAATPGNITAGIDKKIEFSVLPNPLINNATINFSLPQKAHTVIELYDEVGNRIIDILSADMPAGKHSAILKRGDLKTGNYIVHLQIDNNIYSRNIIIE